MKSTKIWICFVFQLSCSTKFYRFKSRTFFSGDVVMLVKILWEGQKIWTNIPLRFDVYSVKFIYSEKATKFWEISTLDFYHYYLGQIYWCYYQQVYNYLCNFTNQKIYSEQQQQWKFHKTLWPSQNIWTLPTFIDFRSSFHS